MYQVMVSPWVSQTFARTIWWTAVKYIAKKDYYKNEDWDRYSTYFIIGIFKIAWAAKTGQAMAWPAWIISTALILPN